VNLIYEFGDHSLDVDRQELRRGEKLVAVEPSVLDLLLYLIRNRDRVITKDDLIAHVWNGRIVSDSTLSSRITAARQAIGDDGDNQRLIRTVARKGIRFVGEITERSSQQSPRSASPASGFAVVPPSLPDKPSIAVLPFTNMSGDPEQEYFSDGISEDIISALSRLRWFFVIGRNSTFAYKGHATDVRQVGRDLGVRYVLEGSIRKSGQRVRITCQLLDAMTGNNIWSERYDRELTDVFMLQDEITSSVIAAIEPKLVASEATRSEKRSIDDLDAWDLVARALSYFWKLSETDNVTAIAMLRQAASRYPNYAPAQSMLAFALLVASYVGWTPPGRDRAEAEQLALRAVELDESDPWAHLALGYLAFTKRQTVDAIRHCRTALELNPNFAPAYGTIGLALALSGQSDEAIKNIEQAIRMSPRDPFNSFRLIAIAAAHYLARRYPEAVTWARRAVEVRPRSAASYRILCACLAKGGQIEEANAAMLTLKQLQPELSIAWIRQSVPYTSGPMEHFLEGMREAGLTS